MDFEGIMRHAIAKGASKEDLGDLGRALDDDDISQVAKLLTKVDAEAGQPITIPPLKLDTVQPATPTPAVPPTLAEVKRLWELGGSPKSGPLHDALRSSLDKEWKVVERQIAEVITERETGFAAADLPAAVIEAGAELRSATEALKAVREKFRNGQATDGELRAAAGVVAKLHDGYDRLGGR